MLSIFAVGKYDSVQLIPEIPFNFSFSCLIFCIPLVYCFYALRSYQRVLVTSSCRAARREIRRKGVGECSLCSLNYTLSGLRGILRKLLNSTPFAKWGFVSPEAPLRGIFHSSSVLTAGQVKNGIVVHGLYSHHGLNSFLQLHVLIYVHSMPLCRIQGLDLNTVLPQTVILGPHKIGPLSSEKVRHLGRELSNFEKLVFDFSVLYIQKRVD